jgi:SAM-dependent methyltransferase
LSGARLAGFPQAAIGPVVCDTRAGVTWQGRGNRVGQVWHRRWRARGRRWRARGRRWRARGRRWPARIVPAAAGALLAAALWWRTHPSACPYNQRFWVEAPHPLITRRRLSEALAPSAGERVLEVGPGTGYYSLPVAERLGPDGSLEIFDLQPQMLEHTLKRARRRGIANLTATQGDAQSLPYENDRFDGAFLVTVLGEIPDQDAALTELRRVIKPGGRLVVGELFGDPHWVRFGALHARARRAGFVLDRRIGTGLGYFARFGSR